MNEHELSEQLHTVAATVNPQPDLAEIELGAGRARNRRRVATGVIAAMLIAGAGGTGFGIGRSVSNDGDQLAAGAAATDVVPTSTPVAPDEVVPEIIANAPAATVLANSNFVAGSSDQAAKEPAAEDGHYESGRLDSYYAQEPMTVVYERILDNGLRIRLQQGQSWGDEQWYGTEWHPALFCWPTVDSRITIDGRDVVDVSGYGWYEELFNGLAVQPIEAGSADGHPMRLLQVQATPDITEVAVTWPDGATDRTVPVNGAAVLVVDGLGAYDGYTLEVTDAAGTRTMNASDLDYYSDPDYRAGCEEPPPALPDAGQQPSDRVAAEAALRDRFQALWDGTIGDDMLADLLDDSTGVDQAIAQIFDGVYSESAESATQTIEDFVFTSPTEAWFRYGIDTINGYFGQRYGYANLIDGLWVFPRALVCQDLSLAGGGCEPWVDSIYPPSWYERYGHPYTECYKDDNGEEVCQPLDGPLVNSPVSTVLASG